MTRAVTKAKTTALAVTNAEVEEFKSRVQAPTGNKIKVDGKVFKLPNGDSDEIMHAVIVEFAYMNAFYESVYDPDNITPPGCFALSLNPNDLVPSPNSLNTQCDNCRSCQQNQFGSAGKGKACRNQIKLALLPADADMDTPLMELTISPTALKPFSGYINAVVRAGRAPYSVLTEFTFDQTVKYDSVRFGNPEPLDDDFVAMVRERRAEARELLLTEPDMEAYEAANEAKPRGRAVAKPASRRRSRS